MSRELCASITTAPRKRHMQHRQQQPARRDHNHHSVRQIRTTKLEGRTVQPCFTTSSEGPPISCLTPLDLTHAVRVLKLVQANYTQRVTHTYPHIHPHIHPHPHPHNALNTASAPIGCENTRAPEANRGVPKNVTITQPMLYASSHFPHPSSFRSPKASGQPNRACTRRHP